MSRLGKHVGRGWGRPSPTGRRGHVPAEGQVVFICQGCRSISPLLSLGWQKAGTEGTGTQGGQGHKGMCGGQGTLCSRCACPPPGCILFGRQGSNERWS